MPVTNRTSTWNADPLTWGQGPRLLEVFLEPTCPFCARAFPKLFELIDRCGADRVSVKIRLHSQPWHMFSGVIVRAILAASTTAGGRDAAKAVMAAVFARLEAFEFDDHCSGPNMDATPNKILARIEAESGVAVARPFALPGLDREIKWHTRYARQNGIHVSPTFMIGGLVKPGMSSGDTVEDWAKAMGIA